MTIAKPTAPLILRAANLLALALVVLILTLLMIRWMGYDFSGLSDTIIGDDRDGYTFPYFIYQAFDNLLNRPTNLSYALIFHNPADSAAAANTVIPFGMALTMMPAYWLSGGNYLLTTNLYIIATFPLTALAAYALARSLLGASRPMGWFFALFLAFVPLRVMHLQLTHPEILSMHWLLLCILCLHRLFDQPRILWAVGLGVCFWLSLLSSAYLTFFFLIYALVYIVYALLTGRLMLTRRQLIFAGLAALIGAGLALPFFGFRFGVSSNLAGHPFGEIVFLSARPLNWFQGTSFLYLRLNGFEVEEKALFFGFVPLILAAAAWRWRRDDSLIPFFFLLVGVAYLFTLGLLIHISGGDSIPSPYMLLMQLPGIGAMRHTPRYSVLAVVGVALLAVYALMQITARLGRTRSIALMAVVSAALLIEFFPYNGLITGRADASFRLTSGLNTGTAMGSLPPFIPHNLNAWLRAQPPETAVFNYPVEDQVNRIYTASLPIHEHPMLNGQATFYPAWYRDRDWNRFPSIYTLWALKQYDISYAMIYTPFLDQPALDAVHQRMTNFPGALTYVETLDSVEIYRVGEAQPRTQMLFEFDEFVPGEGWYSPEKDDAGLTFVWTTGGNFTVTLPPFDQTSPLNLRVRVQHIGAGQDLAAVQLHIGDAAVPLEVRQEGDGTYLVGVISPDAIPAGDLLLSFDSPSGLSPTSLGTGTDGRTLALAFDFIEIRQGE